MSDTGGGGGGSTGSAIADGAAISNAAITPSAQTPAAPLRRIPGPVTKAHAVVGMAVWVQRRRNV